MIRNKKGVSIMIGYVLLVSFVLVMGVVVYQWMKTYIPRASLECPDGVSIFVEDYQCSADQLTFTLKNNGKFNIGGYFIYATTSVGQELATKDLSQNITLGGDALAPSGIKIYGLDNSMKPNAQNSFEYDLVGVDDVYSVEIIPIRWQEANRKKSIVSCSIAKIRESLDCGASQFICEDSCIGLGYECGTICDVNCGNFDGGCDVGESCTPLGQCVPDALCTDTCDSVGAQCGIVCDETCATCDLANAQSLCNALQCEISSCDENYGDCNLADGDGCEINLQTDINNCGVCENVCPAGSTCDTGTCNSCDGTWSAPEIAGVECDGGANCIECSCVDGYEADGAGGCTVPSSIQNCPTYCDWLDIYGGQSYSNGFCRQNPAQCNVNDEIHEEGGDIICAESGSPAGNTCCCVPSP